MSLRSTGLVLALVLTLVLGLGCGGGGGGGGSAAGKSSAKEPQTAREKQLQEAKASGEVDANGQSSWGKWRYTGERDSCYFAAGRKCFKTEAAACQAMRCKAGEKCKSSGAGPATVTCSK
ncbi:MAG TPA: hypothetical protein VNO30_04925 [Kofleriaceae bacterium]|nr:hypothetical protein [Kofleriaceae bacterium]